MQESPRPKTVPGRGVAQDNRARSRDRARRRDGNSFPSDLLRDPTDVKSLSPERKRGFTPSLACAPGYINIESIPRNGLPLTMESSHSPVAGSLQFAGQLLSLQSRKRRGHA